MDFEARIDAVRRRMARDGVGMLIACSNGLHMPDRPDPVVHLSGYRSIGESFVFLHADGTAKLIVSPAADAERVAVGRGAHSWIATDDLATALTSEVSACKGLAGRVAIVGIDALPHLL